MWFGRYMTRNASDQADVSHTELPLTYRISPLSFPLQSCRSRYDCVIIFLKGFFGIIERQLWSGDESVKIQYVNGSFVAGTSASSPGVPRHNILQDISFGQQ